MLSKPETVTVSHCIIECDLRGEDPVSETKGREVKPSLSYRHIFKNNQ